MKSGQVLASQENAGHPVSGAALAKLFRGWFALSAEEKTKFADCESSVKDLGLPKDDSAIASWFAAFVKAHPDVRQRSMQSAHESLKLFRADKQRAVALVASLDSNPQDSLEVYEAVRAHKTLVKVAAD